MRNKLAYGQWTYLLNEAMDEVAQAQMAALGRETVLSITQKVGLLDILCKVLHDLAVSRPTFERNWDRPFARIEQTRTNIERKSYEKWEAQIRARYRRGREKLLSGRDGQPHVAADGGTPVIPSAVVKVYVWGHTAPTVELSRWASAAHIST